LVTHLF